jgi:hypothetical protein
VCPALRRFILALPPVYIFYKVPETPVERDQLSARKVFPMSISNADLLKIIEHFLPGDHLSYKLYEDGSLVVIADTGKKHTFSADQVTSVHNFMKPKKAATTTPKKPTTTPKTASTSKSTS